MKFILASVHMLMATIWWVTTLVIAFTDALITMAGVGTTKMLMFHSAKVRELLGRSPVKDPPSYPTGKKGE